MVRVVCLDCIPVALGVPHAFANSHDLVASNKSQVNCHGCYLQSCDLVNFML